MASPRPNGAVEAISTKQFPLNLLIEMSLLRQGVFLFRWQM